MFSKDIKNAVLSIVCLVVAAVLSLFILSWNHHSLEIANLGVFFFKLLPYIFSLAAICLFPFEKIMVPLRLLLVLAAFGVLFGYSVGKLIYLFNAQVPYQVFYLELQLLTPMIILSLTLALRCGGMAVKDTAIFGIIAILFMISGIEDLTSQFIRIAIVPGYTIPETWDWAQHMTVFMGRVLTKHEAYIFISIHFVLIALVLYFAYTKENLYTLVSKKLKGVQNTKE